MIPWQPKRCPLECSSISATSQETPHQEKKIIMTTTTIMMENLDERLEKIKPRLDLNPSFNQEINTDDLVSENKVELKHFSMGNSSQANESSSHENSICKRQSKQGEFTCKFCNKNFSSVQALGGHQKVHKEEREFTKRRKKMDTRALGQRHHFPSYHSSSSIAQILNDIYGSIDRPSPHGVNIQSVNTPDPSNKLKLERVFQAQNTVDFLSSTASSFATNSRPTDGDDNDFLTGRNDPSESNGDEDDSGLDLSLKL